MIDILKKDLSEEGVTIRAVAAYELANSQKYYGITFNRTYGHLYLNHFSPNEEKGVVYCSNYQGLGFLEFQLQGEQTIQEMDAFLEPHIEAAKGQGLREHQEAVRKANEPIKINPWTN